MVLKNYALGNFFLFSFALLQVTCQRVTPVEGKITKKDISLTDLQSSKEDFLSILKPIAIKRVSDTPEILVVRNYITSYLEKLGWNIELNQFEDQTPYGLKNFANIIASYPIGVDFANSDLSTLQSSDFALKNRVVFACHYDSKFFNDFEFIAATDSAVPCAMLLDLAKFLNDNFDKKIFSKLNRHIQFLFFDGEEAFKDWTDTDSIYGSRYYAKFLKQNFKQESFDKIDLFVLLDLLGGDSSAFPNYFPAATGNVYKLLSSIETNLRNKKMLNKATQYYFTDLKGFGQYGLVEDDHKPFLKENVPILHLIPSPFPSQWHNAKDNLDNLNMNNIQDLRLIMKYFLLQVLNTKKKTNSEHGNEF